MGVVAACCLSLLVWNFSSVYALQMAATGRDERLASLRSDLDAQRANDTAFQAEVRVTLQTSQAEMRTAITRVADILTEVRIRLGGHK